MARLPTPGSDNGTWGDVLNEYLLESLKADGTIKDNAVTSNTIAPNSITNAAIASDAVNASSIADGSITNALLADGTIQEAKLSSDVQTKLNTSGTPDWSDIANKPAVIAAGADQASARVAIGAGTSNLTIGTTGTTAKAGDYQPSAANISDATTIGRSILTAANASAVKTSLSLSKSDVGLSNVDNTSDTAKNSAVATLTNKTLTDAKVNALKDVNDNTILGISATANASSWVAVKNTDWGQAIVHAASDSQPNVDIVLEPKGTGNIVAYTTDETVILADGPNADQNLDIVTKGNGIIKANGSEILTTSGTQTLTNKTLTSPRINDIKDTNGNPALDLGAIPGAVNRVYIDNQSTGNYPTIGATGPDTDIGLALAPKNNGPVNLFGNAPTIAASGGYNGGNLDLNLKSQGTGKVTANGKPVMTSQMAYPFYTDPGRFEPWPQIMCAGGNWTLGSGDMPMTFFVPSTDMTVTNIITMGWNDTTQSGASACRVAIYRVDNLFTWPADMTCIARSAHKPDRWNGAVVDIAPIVDNGAASPSAISSINLTAGQQYAVAFLSVGHSGTVKLSALGGFRKNTLEPHVGFFAGGGYTDITEHLTGGYIEEWTFVWFGLT